MRHTKQQLAQTVLIQEEQLNSLGRAYNSLADENLALTHQVSELNAQIGELTGKLDHVLELIALANKRTYAPRSEYISPLQQTLFDLEEEDTEQKPVLPRGENKKPRAEHNRGGKRKIDLSKLERVVVTHRLPESERVCPKCGRDLELMTQDKLAYKVLKLVPAHLVVEEHHQEVWVCRTCSKQNQADGGQTPVSIVSAHIPRPPLVGSFASASLIASIAYDKYVNHLPLYRQEKTFAMLGAAISRQDMSNWIVRVYDDWFSIVYEHMRSRLLAQDLIHADETRLQVIDEPDRSASQQSWVWMFCSGRDEVDICIYHYDPTRTYAVASEFLSGWEGTLCTDGYKAYYKLGENVTNIACLAHIRRKFYDVVKLAGGVEVAKAADSVALYALEAIQDMFALDASFDTLSADKRKQERVLKLKPLMDEFEAWCKCEIEHATPQMALHRALSYALEYWPYVKNVLDDGRAELTNNRAERAMRPIALGRNNWKFCYSQKGAQASVGFYSIIETAKRNNLKPKDYIEWLLNELPNAQGLDEFAIRESFMPWSKSVPDSCRITNQ